MDRNDIKGELIKIAAQMARRKNMPDVEAWRGWDSRGVPKKLITDADLACEKARDQCGDWACTLRDIANAI
jgi:hypothetical protein